MRGRGAGELVLGDLFDAQATRSLHATAVRHEAAHVTFGELADRVHRLTTRLAGRGVRPETPVGLCVERGVDMVAGLFAIVRAGGVLVPLDPRHPDERLRLLLDDCSAPLVLTRRDLAHRLTASGADPVFLDAEAPNDAGFVPEDAATPLLHAGPPAADALVTDPPATGGPTVPGPLPLNAACLTYTSGSSGTPKGVTVTHVGLTNLFHDHRARVVDPAVRDAGGRRLRVAHTAPLSFDASWAPLLWLLAGHELHIVDHDTHEDAAAMLAYVEHHRIDVLDETPSHLRPLVASGLLDEGRHRPSVITVGGEALDSALSEALAAAPGTRCYNSYGPTEATVDALVRPVRPGERPLIGRPVAGLRARVLDGALRPVPAGTPGELYLAGPGLARGYHGHPGRTAAGFVADPHGPAGSRLYRTGDLVRTRADGETEFLGRVDDQVQIRGVRVEPRESEAALMSHPEVADAVVVPGVRRDGAAGHAFLAGYAVTARTPAGARTGPAELRAFFDGVLPRPLVPAVLIVLDRIPLLPNGKVDRRALPPAEPDAGVAHESPRTPAEELVAEVWQRALGVARVGVHDDFLALGGDSVLAMRIVSELRRHTGSVLQADNLTTAALFEHGTVAAVAAAAGTADRAHPIEALPRDRPLPLSAAQQRLWFLDQFQPGGTEYGTATGFRLRGELDTEALRTALDALVARHEPLRTTFDTVDGRGVQIVGPPFAVPVEPVDLTGRPEPERSAEADRVLHAELGRPFDLRRGPLLRVLLVRSADDDHLLVLHQHHIVTDGWSTGVLTGDLGELYSAAARGEPPRLAPLPVQYADFAAWQHERLAGPALDGALAYWRRQLAGMSPAELPTDRPRTAVRTFSGALHRFTVPASLTARLTEVGRACGATPFMVLAAAVQVLLARYGGQRDVALGTATSGRDLAELEGLAGFFVNTVVLRSQVDGALAFTEFLGRVRATVLEAFAHDALPYDRLVDAVRPERDASRSPLFQLALVLQNAPRQPLRMAGLHAEETPLPSTSALFDVTLELEPRDGALAGTIEYNTDLFAPDTAARLAGHLLVLLEGIAAQPRCRLSRLPMLTAAELSRLSQWSWAGETGPAGRTVCDLVAEQARRRPGATAVTAGEETLTYARLLSRADEVAARLTARGIGPGAVVGVCLERGVTLVVALLGILRAGAAYLPLDPRYPAGRLAFMLTDSAVDLVLTEERLRDALPAGAAHLAYVDDVPGQAPVNGTDRTARTDPRGSTAAGPRDLVYVMYTSGSTGGPKGVLVEHRSVVRLCRAREIRPGPRDVLALTSSVSFDAATYEIWGALTNGARLAIAPPGVLSVHELGRFLAAEGVTSLWLTAGLFEEVVDTDPGVLGGLRRLIAGGDVLSSAHCDRALRAVPGLELVNGYGPTEGTTFTTCHRFDARQPVTSAPIGRPIDGTRCHVVDGALRPVPVGVPGELLIGGEGLSRGYLGRPGLTAARFVADPFSGRGGERLYRTGDLVRWRSTGELEFLGRSDDQVKIRGFRVEVAEVEEALTRHPDVGEATVVARTDVGHRRLVAYVTARHTPAPTPAALRTHLEGVLPGYLVPTGYVVLDRMPLTAHGKVDRRALPPPRPPERGHVAPRTPAERTLSQVWADVLGVARIGVEDNFFDLGGDSILSIQVVARARAAGLRLTSKDIFLRQTVARLATAATAGTSPAPGTAAPAGPVPLTPVQRWFLDGAAETPGHFNQWLMAELVPGVRAEALRAAVTAVSQRHDAWRLRFEKAADGWRQHTATDGEGLAFRHIDLSDLDTPAQETAIATAVAQTQNAVCTDTGPPAHVVLFTLGPGRASRLLLTAHHLVVDGVSWRVLLTELDGAYRQAAAGAPVDLGPRTTSFQEWARRLSDHTAAGGFDEETPHWTDVTRSVRAELPTDLAGRNTLAAERTMTVTLDRAHTEALLRTVPGTYRTQVNDVLLSALAVVTARWTGRPEVALTLEGHGREEVLPGADTDLSGTVGWFTSLFPVVLCVPGAAGWGEVIKSVKEQLRAVPNRGVGYGALRRLGPADTRRALAGAEPPLSFNYLGRFDTETAPGGLFHRPPGPIDLYRDASEGDRERLLDVTAAVTDGVLEFTWHYCADLHREATVRALADGVLTALEEIVAHCARPGSGGATPSDFPLAGLDQAEVDRLVGDGTSVLDVYPLTSMQSGMLFHSLSEPGVYLEQVHLVLDAVADPVALARAWQRTVDRTPELRTAVVWTDEGTPLQAVHRQADLPVTHHDWRALPPAEESDRLRELLAADRTTALDLAAPPAARLILVRLPQDRVRLVWTFHHLLLDGWSVSQVLADVLTRHASPGTELPPRPPFRDHVRWLAGQDFGRAAAHWRAVLGGLRSPTALPFDRPPARAHSGRATAAVDVRLSAAGSTALHAFARRQRLTTGTVVQGMWAVLLSQYGGGDDVCFGVTVSGRPPDVPGIESMVGMFINTVPVRVAFDPAAELVPWLRALQDGRIEAQPHDHVPLTGLRSFGEVPADVNLFDSIVVFENYPIAPALAAHGVTAAGLDAVEVTNYPLNAVVFADDELSLRLTYDPALFDEATPRGMARHLVALLADVGADPWRPLGSLPRPDGTRGHSPAGPAVPVRRPGPVPYAAPRTRTEHGLVRIWAQVLRLERVGVHDDFFVLGGDSILCVQITSRIRAALGVEVSPRTLFDHPTVARLAQGLPAPDGRRPVRGDAVALAPGVSGAGPAGHRRTAGDGTATPAPRAPGAGERATGTPLSFGQRRLWFLHCLAPHGADYNSALSLRLRGPLDSGALAAALTTITQRHEILRTVFTDSGTGAVLAHRPSAPRLTDLSAFPEAERGAELDRVLRAETVRPFDLRRGPVLRAALLRLAHDDHVLHLGMHHIVSDGWSMGVLTEELGACYSAAVRGSDLRLPPLPAQYADFADWQRRRRSTPAADARLAYWRRTLAGVQTLDLPTDRPRPAVRTATGRHRRFEIPAALTGRLRALGARHDTTLFTVLVAALQVVLARHCAQDDIAIGTAVAGRDRPEFERLVGFFVNTVVLRGRVDETRSFAGLLGETRAMVMAAFEHAETPFEQVVEALGVERDTGRTPLVQVMAVLQNTPRVAPALAGLRVSEVETDTPAAPFDLTFDFRELSGALVGDLCYNADLFAAATADRLARHLLALLEAAANAPDTPLCRFSVLDAQERRETDAVSTGAPARPAGASVAELFDTMVRRHPRAPAVRGGGQVVTYQELNRRAERLAARLAALGVRRGDRVCVVLPPGVRAVTVFVALARTGAAYVAVEPDVPPHRLRAIVDGCGATVVLTRDTVLPAGPAASRPRPGPEDPLACVYTSGSTGHPKGVVITHGAMVNLLSWTGAGAGAGAGTDTGIRLGAGDRCGQVADLSFDASVWEVWSALCRGACLCVAEPHLRRDPRALGRWVAAEELTACFFPTAVGERLFAERALDGADRLRHVLLGGERLTRLPAGPVPYRVLNGYGPSETTVFATCYDATDWPAEEREGWTPPPIGRPLPGVRAYVLDRCLRMVPHGVTGELYLGGHGVAQGYLGAPATTADRFVADPFAPTPGARMYRTGDLARRTAEGLLEFRGRTDRQIKVAGVRVELDGVEQLLARHESVAEAVVTACDDAAGRPGLRAHVTAAPSGTDPGELRDWLLRHLPAAAVPAPITVLRALPRTATGKTDRRALAARPDPAPEPVARRAPRTETERAVERHWAGLLGRRAFDVREKFFDAGGSSLALLDLRSRMEDLCGRELPVALLFEHPTIEAMARLVDERRGPRTPTGTRHDL
ncbi:amino acid adenylation domain-containing protein [Streptomyces sp. NPDC017991]|uniref:amino acid adenylation domain-containing protein n=1 Tax=Streptomyces sp. NPDC017991 TaxID=3365026 RepID=UPI0037B98233